MLAQEEQDPDSKAISRKRQVYQKAYQTAFIRQRDREARGIRGGRPPERGGGRPRQHQRDPLLDYETEVAGPPPPMGAPRHGFGGVTPPPPPPGPAPRRAGDAGPSAPGPPPRALPVTTTVSAAPELRIKRAEQSEGLIAMVPAALQAKAMRASQSSQPAEEAPARADDGALAEEGGFFGLAAKPKPSPASIVDGPTFLESAVFAGKREGFVFKSGALGVGYYADGSRASSAGVVIEDAARKHQAGGGSLPFKRKETGAGVGARGAEGADAKGEDALNSFLDDVLGGS